MDIQYHILQITIPSKEVMADIIDATYITADNMIVDNEKIKSSIMDAAEDGRRSRVITFMNRAWGELLHAISGYIYEPLTDDISELSQYTEGYYIVSLNMPETFNTVSVQAVKGAMQDYLVDSALAGYFAIVKKDEAGMYYEKASTDLARVKKFLASRISPQRLKMFPHW